MYKRIADFFLYLWQLPQNILGLLLIAIYKGVFYASVKGNNHASPPSRLYFSKSMSGGVSLGRYILLSEKYKTTFNTWYHERGHAIQSLILGPLYLIVVGLPSLLWAAWWTPDRGVSYYSFYTERWADKLGGVKR